jgi:hypothetical protein
VSLLQQISKYFHVAVFCNQMKTSLTIISYLVDLESSLIRSLSNPS